MLKLKMGSNTGSDTLIRDAIRRDQNRWPGNPVTRDPETLFHLCKVHFCNGLWYHSWTRWTAFQLIWLVCVPPQRLLCYLSHCYSIALGQIYKITCVLLSVCLSVCPRSCGRMFCSIFRKFCTEVGGLKSKKDFVRSHNPTIHSPTLPQFFTPAMHFQ